MKEFLTIEDLGQTLGVTSQTVSKIIKEKRLKTAKLGNSYKIPKNEFTNFINSNIVAKKSSGANSSNLQKVLNLQEDPNGKRSIDHEKFSIEPLEINHDFEFNYFVYGENEKALNLLLPIIKKRVDLIYIDPPFGTGQIFSDIEKNHAYDDKLIKYEFLSFLKTRLLLLRECLSPQGSIFVHIDKKIGHYVKVLMDEIFGYENFINDITRIKCNPKNFKRKAFGNISDIILFYAKKRDRNIWNDVKKPLTELELKKFFSKLHKNGRRYTTNPLHAPGETINGDTGMKWKGLTPPKGRHWRYGRKELDELDRKGLIEWSSTGNPRKIVFADDHTGKKLQDIWEFKDRGMSYIDYPTQKNAKLLETIILNSSNEDSLVLDCFAGSGTTLIAADKFNRKWIGIDNSLQAYTVCKNNLSRLDVQCNYYQMVSDITNS